MDQGYELFHEHSRQIRAKDGSQLIKEEDLADCITKALHEANPLYPCPQIWDRKEIEAIFRKIM
ncbi:MAG: hypothetical protein L6V82_05830 [Clostridiales bacterium]|nr:MAG: hypothetical protein L6V82_05830 [Clostridiales bacterium]